MKYYSSRINSACGYLEVIHRDNAPIAYITDAYGSIRDPLYVGIYGIHEVTGRTVAAVKTELFALLDAGQ
jgi:hypothetical protein